MLAIDSTLLMILFKSKVGRLSAPSQILHSETSAQDGFSSHVRNDKRSMMKFKIPPAISNAPPTSALTGPRIASTV